MWHPGFYLWRWWEPETTVIAICQGKCCRCCWYLGGRFLWWMQPESRWRERKQEERERGVGHNRKHDEETREKGYSRVIFSWVTKVSVSRLPLAVWRGSLWENVWSRRKPRTGKDCHSNKTGEEAWWVERPISVEQHWVKQRCLTAGLPAVKTTTKLQT